VIDGSVSRRMGTYVTLHLAIRGTIPRAVIRDTIAATYHQVWWPPADQVVYDGDHLPIWADLTPDPGDRLSPISEPVGCYVDPATGATLPTWDEALDGLDQDDDGSVSVEPHHVLRFGAQYDAQGLLAGAPDADMRIGYLADCHTTAMEAQRAHVDRLASALRYQPCSPACPNWLRYGIQPKDARAGMRPGCCKPKPTPGRTWVTAAAASW